MKKKTNGFTALELLMVIAVISILAGILLSGVTAANKRARISRMKAFIESITVAMSAYRNDYYVYPPTDIPGVGGETPAECLYYFLGANFTAGNNSGINSGPYFEFRDTNRSAWTNNRADMNGDGDTTDDVDKLYQVVDAWNSPLSYTIPGVNNTNSVDIYSFGPNGNDNNGNNDDINNWE